MIPGRFIKFIKKSLFLNYLCAIRDFIFIFFWNMLALIMTFVLAKKNSLGAKLTLERLQEYFKSLKYGCRVKHPLPR